MAKIKQASSGHHLNLVGTSRLISSNPSGPIQTSSVPRIQSPRIHSASLGPHACLVQVYVFYRFRYPLFFSRRRSCSSMAPRPGTRRAQVTSGGLGKHFGSPRRPRDKHKTQRYIEIAGHSAKRRRLATRLEQLHSVEAPSSPLSVETFSDQLDDELGYENHIDSSDQEFVPSDSESYQVIDDTQLLEATSEAQPLARKHVLPDISAERLCGSWKTIIPTLIQPYLHYVSRTLGRPLPPFSLAITLCSRSQCMRKTVSLLCLLFDRKFL